MKVQTVQNEGWVDPRFCWETMAMSLGISENFVGLLTGKQYNSKLVAFPHAPPHRVGMCWRLAYAVVPAVLRAT